MNQINTLCAESLLTDNLEKLKELSKLDRDIILKLESILDKRLRYIYTKYNITEENFVVMLQKQKYKCPICEKDFTDGIDKVAVDHNHKNNKIRGLIHNHCNLLLGHAFDSPQTLRNAANYLEENNE